MTNTIINRIRQQIIDGCLDAGCPFPDSFSITIKGVTKTHWVINPNRERIFSDGNVVFPSNMIVYKKEDSK